MDSACNIMHMKLYLSLAKIIWFSSYDTIQRVSRCRFTQQVWFQHLQSCNTLKSVLQFHSDSHTTWKHSLRLLICIETLMDSKIVNYPKRAHEERHGRLVVLHIHSERNSHPDSPHLQLFLSGHKPLFLQGARGGSKAQTAIEAHSNPTTIFVMSENILY